MASDQTISRLTCTQETYAKYEKKKTQRISETVVAMSHRNESAHERMCYFVLDKDIDRIRMLSHLLQRCFGSYDDQDCFGLSFEKEMIQRKVDMKDIPSVFARIPEIYNKAMDDVVETRDDVVSHSNIIPECCPMIVTQIPVGLVTKTIHNAFILECTLSRTRYREIRKKTTHVSSSIFEDPVMMIRTNKNLCLDENDHLFRDIIILFPLAGVFYTCVRQFQELSRSSNITSSSVPLPLSWLRLRHKDGQPASNAFLKKIHRCWSLDWGEQLTNNDKTVKECYQWSDVENGSPLLPPDVYLDDKGKIEKPGNKQSMTHHMSREQYRTRLIINRNDSDKKGSRRYVSGALHRNLWLQMSSGTHPRPLVYDHRIRGNITFIVQTRRNDGRPESLSYIRVTSLLRKDQTLLDLLHHRAREFTRTGSLRKAANARCNKGDLGSMTTVGNTAARGNGSTFVSEKLFTKDKTLSMILPKISTAAKRFCEREYPGVIPTFRYLEDSAGEEMPSEFGGRVGGMTSAITLSLNLMNTTHYDVHDGSVSFAIWTETIPGDSQNWFFVLPNILVEYDGTTYHGLCIQLFHGVSVLWDGRVIRHGTSIHTQRQHTDGNMKNHTISWFWAVSSRSMNATVNKTREDHGITKTVQGIRSGTL